MFRFIAILTLPLILASCASCGQSGPANRPDPDPENCASACAKLKDLGCPEGDDIFIPDQSADAAPDTGTSVTCTFWCEDTQQKGHALDAACVSKITACADISTCDW